MIGVQIAYLLQRETYNLYRSMKVKNIQVLRATPEQVDFLLKTNVVKPGTRSITFIPFNQAVAYITDEIKKVGLRKKKERHGTKPVVDKSSCFSIPNDRTICTNANPSTNTINTITINNNNNNNNNNNFITSINNTPNINTRLDMVQSPFDVLCAAAEAEYSTHSNSRPPPLVTSSPSSPQHFFPHYSTKGVNIKKLSHLHSDLPPKQKDVDGLFVSPTSSPTRLNDIGICVPQPKLLRLSPRESNNSIIINNKQFPPFPLPQILDIEYSTPSHFSPIQNLSQPIKPHLSKQQQLPSIQSSAFSAPLIQHQHQRQHQYQYQLPHQHQPQHQQLTSYNSQQQQQHRVLPLCGLTSQNIYHPLPSSKQVPSSSYPVPHMWVTS